MLRAVSLPADVVGRLFLSAMPGRHEVLASATDEIVRYRIGRVVRLTTLDEVEKKSPSYARAIKQGTLPWADEVFDVPDYQAPNDRETWLGLTRTIAARLRSGERILIHCAGGIGRTGTLAVCVLMALGVAERQARENIAVAGSGPESPMQEEIIRWTAGQAPNR